MIQTEMIGERILHYSDQGMKIRQIETGKLYEDAIDVMPCQYTYEETDIPIPVDEEEIDDNEALNIILGRNAR